MGTRTGWSGLAPTGAAPGAPRRTPRRRPPPARSRRRPTGSCCATVLGSCDALTALDRAPAPQLRPLLERLVDEGWVVEADQSSRRATERAGRRPADHTRGRGPAARLRRPHVCDSRGPARGRRARHHVCHQARHDARRDARRAATSYLRPAGARRRRPPVAGGAARRRADRPLRRARAIGLPALRRRPPRGARRAPRDRAAPARRAAGGTPRGVGPAACSSSASPGPSRDVVRRLDGETPALRSATVTVTVDPRGDAPGLAAPPALRLRLGLAHHHSLSSLPSMARRCSREQVSQ